jgi:hypothetical protein
MMDKATVKQIYDLMPQMYTKEKKFNVLTIADGIIDLTYGLLDYGDFEVKSIGIDKNNDMLVVLMRD